MLPQQGVYTKPVFIFHGSGVDGVLQKTITTSKAGFDAVLNRTGKGFKVA